MLPVSRLFSLPPHRLLKSHECFDVVDCDSGPE